VVQGVDFRPGSDFVQQMHQAVEEAQRHCCIRGYRVEAATLLA
jgi:hypothetical protein